MSLRDQILQCKDIQSEQLVIPQWDVIVEVRGLNGRQRAALFKETMDNRGAVDLAKMYPRLALESCYDPDTGELVFQEGDFDAVAEKSGAALELIAQVAMRLSGIGNAEELVKN